MILYGVLTFSILKLIKTERRNCLSEDHLDDLMHISVDGHPLSQWDAAPSVHLWWKDKQRRVLVGGNKPDCTSVSSSSSSTDSEGTLTPLDFSELDFFE